MFGFGKGKSKKTEEEKRTEGMPKTKKVQFDPVPLEKAVGEITENPRAILQYKPVNYYATKDSFLLCVFYYNNEYTEIYMRLEYCVNDVSKGKSPVFTIDKDLMRDILRKFGQNIP